MFRKNPEDIEMQDLSFIKAENTHLSAQGWIQMVFDSEAKAREVSVKLKAENLVQDAPAVNPTHKGQAYGEGKFFIRIHMSAYEAIANKYKLSGLAALEKSSAVNKSATRK